MYYIMPKGTSQAKTTSKGEKNQVHTLPGM